MAVPIVPAVLRILPARVCFAYEHAYRVVEVTRVWVSHEGHLVYTGIDEDVDAYRSFRADRIHNTIKKVK